MTATNALPRPDDTPASRIAHVPVTVCAIGTGIMVLTFAMRAAEQAFDWPVLASSLVLLLLVMTLGAVSLGDAILSMNPLADVRSPAAGRCGRTDPSHKTCQPGGHHPPSRTIHRLSTGDRDA